MPIILHNNRENLFHLILIEIFINGWKDPNEWNLTFRCRGSSNQQKLGTYRAKIKVFVIR